MQVTFLVAKTYLNGKYLPMADNDPHPTDEKVLKTSPRIHARIKAVSKSINGATMRSTTDLMLEHILPSFESGKFKLGLIESDSE